MPAEGPNEKSTSRRFEQLPVEKRLEILRPFNKWLFWLGLGAVGILVVVVLCLMGGTPEQACARSRLLVVAASGLFIGGLGGFILAAIDSEYSRFSTAFATVPRRSVIGGGVGHVEGLWHQRGSTP